MTDAEARCDDYPVLRSRYCWEVTLKDPHTHGSDVIRYLHLVFPEGVVLCFDNLFMPEEPICTYILERQPKHVLDLGETSRCIEVTIGSSEEVQSVGCQYDRLHMILSRENLEGLAALMDCHGRDSICNNLYVYENQTILMTAYDVFDMQAYIHGDIPRERVVSFCKAARLRFRRARNNVLWTE